MRGTHPRTSALFRYSNAFWSDLLKPIGIPILIGFAYEEAFEYQLIRRFCLRRAILLMSLQSRHGSKRPWAAITQGHPKAATSVLGGTRAAAHGHSFPILPSPAPCRASIFFAFGCVCVITHALSLLLLLFYLLFIQSLRYIIKYSIVSSIK